MSGGTEATGDAAADAAGSGPALDAATTTHFEPQSPDDEALLHDSLIAAEDQLRQAMVAGDVTALGALLDDHVIYTGPDGRQVAKQQDLEAYATGAVEITAYEEQHRSVRVVGRTGITWVLTEVRGRAGNQNFGTRLRYTRTWVYDTGWRVVAAHASFAPPR